MTERHIAPPGTWGWRTDRFRNAVWRAYIWCRLAGALIVGMAAIAGRHGHESLSDAVVWVAVAFMAWVVVTSCLCRPIRRVLERRPMLGLAEVGVGMAVVVLSGPNGSFSGWTAAPIAMAAILRPGWRWLASIAAIQVVLVWIAGLAMLAWTADPTYTDNVTLTRALLSPIDYVISYGLIALLGAALRRGDRLRANEEKRLEAARGEAARQARRADDAATEAGRQRARVDAAVGRPCEEVDRLLGVLARDVEHLPALRADLARLQRWFTRLKDISPPGVRNLGELLGEVFAAREIDTRAVRWLEGGDDVFNPLTTRVSEDAARHLLNFAEEAVGNMRRHGDPPYLIEASGKWAPDDASHDTITIAFVSHQRPHAPDQHGRWILHPGRRADRRSHGIPILERAAAELGGHTGLRRTTRVTGGAYERILEFPAHRVRAAVEAPAE